MAKQINTNKTSQIITPSKKIKTTFYDSSLEPLCKEHLAEMAPLLCPQDQAELESTYALPAREGLAICLQKSSVAFAWFYRGHLGAVTGVAAENLLGSLACVWSFTSWVARRYPYAFYRMSKHVLAYFKTLYPHLYAVCDERYQMAQHYLQHLGAKKTGSPFYLATKDTQFQLYLFSNK